MWEKKGLVFSADRRNPWMHSHCQLPVSTRVEGDIYRVYFASRTVEQKSHIGFVDFDITNPSEILNVSENPALTPGPLGHFDEFGVYPSCVVGKGDEKWMYYIGWIRGYENPMFYAAIGLAISTDGGNTYQKYSNCPIMERGPHDPTLVTSPHVFWDEDIWRMTYVSGIKWERIDGQLKSFYHIKSATSSDGINWERAGDIAIDFKDDNERNIARSAVVKEDGIYKMWFSYVEGDLQYRIGYSESEDFITWERMDNRSGISVTPGDFDSDMTCYPNIVIHKGEKYMFYNGNSFGKDGFAMAKWKK